MFNISVLSLADRIVAIKAFDPRCDNSAGLFRYQKTINILTPALTITYTCNLAVIDLLIYNVYSYDPPGLSIHTQ